MIYVFKFALFTFVFENQKQNLNYKSTKTEEQYYNSITVHSHREYKTIDSLRYLQANPAFARH